MAMIATLIFFTGPLLIGVILLAFGLCFKDRWLRVSGDAFLVVAGILMILQFFMVKDHTSWVEYGIFLDSWSDYVSFAGIIIVAGILAADGIVQVMPKKSSSS